MSWFSSLFHQQNPADAANKYISQIPGQTNQYMQPYFDAGKNQLGALSDQYGGLMNDPGGKVNKIGESFHESPGFKFAMEQAMQQANQAAARGGMSGTPAHQFDAMTQATGLANQDYYNWLGNATGLYKEGLHGSQDMAHYGQQAGQSMMDNISQALSQQGNYAFQGQNLKNQQNNGLWGGLGALGGSAMGGPFGAYLGHKLFGPLGNGKGGY